MPQLNNYWSDVPMDLYFTQALHKSCSSHVPNKSNNNLVNVQREITHPYQNNTQHS